MSQQLLKRQRQRTMAKNYQLDSIVLRDELQCRVSVSQGVISEYAALIREGVKMPPLRCVRVGGELLLVDGFARYLAHEKLGKSRVACEVVDGTMADAIMAACSANSTHGVPRTNADKHRALRLAEQTWPEKSNRDLANICSVSSTFVDQHRTRDDREKKEKPAKTAKAPRSAPVGAGAAESGSGTADRAPRSGAPVASAPTTKNKDCPQCFNNEMVLLEEGWACSLCFAPEVSTGDMEVTPATVANAAAVSFDVLEVDEKAYKEFLSHIGRAVRSAREAGLLELLGPDLDALKAKAIKLVEGK